MNEAIVKRTQDTLGKVIGKKPPLTEKLLNRPPFRFLHDVITSVSSTSTIAHNKTADPATITDNGCLCGSHMHLILILLLPIIILTTTNNSIISMKYYLYSLSLVLPHLDQLTLFNAYLGFYSLIKPRLSCKLTHNGL